MKTIILILSLFILISCSSQELPKDNKVDSTHLESPELPKYKFTEFPVSEFDYTTYNSWTVISVARLDKLVRVQDKMNLKTMQFETTYEYIPTNSCSIFICNQYKIDVEYTIDSIPSTFVKTEYVSDVPMRQVDWHWKSELADNSDFYKKN